MKTIKKFFDLFTPPERKHAFLLVGMAVIMALLDMLGVASILPFMAVLTNPDILYTNSILNKVFLASQNFNVETADQFLFIAGVFSFFLLIVALTFKALYYFLQTRFVLMREYSIGKRLVQGYLQQPYSWFLDRHSADLGKNVLSEVSTVINRGMVPLFTLISQTTVAFAFILLLLLADPIAALSVCVGLGLIYSIIFAITSAFLKRIGQERIRANQERFTAINETFGAFKQVKVAGLENAFVERFSKPAKIFAKGQAAAQLITQLPRFGVEALAFGGILLIILYTMASKGEVSNALPYLTLYAFSGYRLLPALQQIYGSLSQLRFIGPALDNLYLELANLEGNNGVNHKLISLPFTKAISLNKVNYRYDNSSRVALKDINLTVESGSTVGFVGATGSGKTTLIDVLLGLLEPQQGSLMVDGQIVTATNLRQWHKLIGYVPQQISLTEDSVAANIAFGVSPENIDINAVEHAAKVANLHDFVLSELQQGYETTVGEQGVRLSGGQRQRIGIARALYHNPKLLVLDEATSALDGLTEQVVMDAINNLGQGITTIIIAHRLATVRNCDQIFMLEHGTIVARGTFAELVKSNKRFQEMNSSS